MTPPDDKREIDPPFSHGIRVLRVIMRHTSSDTITAERIVDATGVAVRNIAPIVNIAAQNGVPVMSTATGYCRRTKGEIDEYLAREKSRLISLGRKLSQVKKNQADELQLFEAQP